MYHPTLSWPTRFLLRNPFILIVIPLYEVSFLLLLSKTLSLMLYNLIIVCFSVDLFRFDIFRDTGIHESECPFFPTNLRCSYALFL
jgi:hypothetical protein